MPEIVPESAQESAILLRAQSVSKSFSGIRALENVTFELRAGEVHALIGENGAGKSTLVKIITGALAAESGSLMISGTTIEKNSPALARSLGIAAIYQQPSLFPHLTVAENIAIALERTHTWRRVDWKGRVVRARELLDAAGSQIDPERPVHALSMPEQQIVEIAKAIGANAHIVIMDEPTASLTDREVDKLFAVVRGLRRQQAGIIYISHRLEEISQIADRVTVLRDGHSVATRSMAGIDKPELIRLMVGRELSTVFPKRKVTLGETALEIRNLTSVAAGIRNVSLSVRGGEILGIAGLVGAGRTELAETLFGLTPADSGTISIRNRPVTLKSPADAIRCGIAYVPEDRRQHGVILPFPVAANTTLASLKLVSRMGFINSQREHQVAKSYISDLRIKAASLYQETSSLSGGNQQKVALARWLATRPRILILDEPTQGVDVGSKAEIHQLMVELAGQGLAIIMISSELPEILGMSDRIAVMHDGTVAGVLDREEATPESILALALGQPAGASLGRAH